MGYELTEKDEQMIKYSDELNCENCDRLYDCDNFNTDENIINCMKNKLFDDLKEIQRKRDLVYKYNKQYLYLMGSKKLMSYIDYLNIIENKKEIERLNEKGSEIVKRLVNEFGWCKI